jgi:hypothetical protein
MSTRFGILFTCFGNMCNVLVICVLLLVICVLVLVICVMFW